MKTRAANLIVGRNKKTKSTPAIGLNLENWLWRTRQDENKGSK